MERNSGLRGRQFRTVENCLKNLYSYDGYSIMPTAKSHNAQEIVTVDRALHKQVQEFILAFYANKHYMVQEMPSIRPQQEC